MKINEYNQMMSYLTRPGKVLGNNINSKKIPHTERSGFAKGTKSDTKAMPNNSKMLQYINDHRIVFDGKEASKEATEAAVKRIEAAPKNMSYQDEYKMLYGKEPKKVAEKPKPNGTTTFTSDDWDLIINSTEFPHEMFDDSWTKKKAGILEQDLANEYWQTQFENYQNQGGTLSYQQWMQQQMNLKVSNEINKRVKDKQRTEGIAAILGIPGNKI